MAQKITKIFISIILLVYLISIISCQKRVQIDDGWKSGRYDLTSNISYAELDKICYDLGTPSARKILQTGWGKDVQSLDGISYVRSKQRASIIELPAMPLISRELSFQAFPFLPSGISSASVALYLNGHLLKRIKLLPGWRSYSVPIKGKYFSLKSNLLLFEHTVGYPNSKRLSEKEKKKLSVAYNKICLIRGELAGQEKKITDNFIQPSMLTLAGDTRAVLETRANNRFSYQISLSNPVELHFSLGLSEEKVAKIEKIEFQISAKKNGSTENLLFSRSYHSDKHKLWQGWNDFNIDLSSFKDSNISLFFKTHLTSRKNYKVNTISWGNPFIITPQSKSRGNLNVIIYLVDTLRADHVASYSKRQIRTPYIDKFASEGVLFESAFSQCSWTKPSTASLLTSTYPSFHGAITRHDALTDAITTLAEYLKDNGYLTGAFINQPNISADFGFSQGFDSYVETYCQIMERPLFSLHMNQLIFPWLEKNANRPFFLYIHTIDPHDPYTPPPPYDSMYDSDYKGSINGSVKTIQQILGGKLKVSQRDIQHLESLYDGEITLNDLAFGELIERLKKLQLYDSTLIIFTSDHGEEFYEHQGLKHGLTLYDEQIRIPLIMRLPSHFPAGIRISPTVRLIDIMPTILELLNLSTIDQCQGKSLIPLITGEVKSLIEEIYLEEDLDGAVLQSVRGKRWKLISYPKTGFLELFDLDQDPKEIHNLAAQYPELTNSLMEMVRRWHQEQIEKRAGLHRPEIKKLSEETIKQLKALGYLN